MRRGNGSGSTLMRRGLIRFRLRAEDMREIFSAVILPGASPPFNARYTVIFDRTHRNYAILQALRRR